MRARVWVPAGNLNLVCLLNAYVFETHTHTCTHVYNILDTSVTSHININKNENKMKNKASPSFTFCKRKPVCFDESESGKVEDKLELLTDENFTWIYKHSAYAVRCENHSFGFAL